MATRITAAQFVPTPQTAFVIESAGAHKFTYAKIAEHNGQTVWRWPLEEPLSRRVQATGTLVDISA